MEQFESIAEARVDKGKGASRRLRRDGKVPAIVYGGDAAPENIQLAHNELLHQSENEAFYSHILTLDVAGAKQPVVLKDMQRHPYKAQIMHVDLLRVDEKEALTMRVPLHFLNEEKCVGVKMGGGEIRHVMNDIEIVCLPKDLPEYIEVDVAELNIGDTVHIGELKVPGGVEVAALMHGGDPQQPVVSVEAARISEEPSEGEEGAADETPEAGGDGDEGADG